MAFFGVAMFFCATPILHTFTHEDSVIAIARQLILMAAFFQIFDGAQVVATGTLRGAGNTRASLLANLIGHWFVGFPMGLTLCFWMGWARWESGSGWSSGWPRCGHSHGHLGARYRPNFMERSRNRFRAWPQSAFKTDFSGSNPENLMLSTSLHVKRRSHPT